MKLKPRQIVGLIAIVVFGAILLIKLFEPKRDPFHVPGAMRMSSGSGAALPVSSA